jgi:outer membrane immunogenic protein
MLASRTIASFIALAAFSAPVAAEGLLDRGRAGHGVATWTGFYVGAHAGYAWSDWGVDLTHTTGAIIYNDPFPKSATSLGSSEGLLGGLQIGANYQSGAIVFGLEADVSWADLDAEGTFDTVNTGPCKPNSCTRWNIQSSLDTFGTVRGRLGFSTGPLLLYGTGGLAWGIVDTKQTSHHNGPDFATPGGVVSGDSNHIGYAVGAGGEYRFSRNWSVKLEYLFIDLGEADYQLTGTTSPTSKTPWAESLKQDLELHTVRLGINYKFD